MNPTNTSTITSVVLFVLGSLGTLLVTKGVMTQDQANALMPELGSVIIAIGGIALVWWKRQSHTPAAVVAAATTVATTAARAGTPPDPALATALTAAVNSKAVPGVKAVAASSPSPPVSVSPSGLVAPLPASPAAALALGAVFALVALLASHGSAMAAGRVTLPIDPLHLNQGGSILKAVTGEPVSTPDAVRGVINQGLVPTIIAGMTVLNTVASKVNPDSKDPSPYNTYLPEAVQCIAVAIPWLQSIPTEASVPQPTNPDGTVVPSKDWDLFTTIGMAEIKSDALQDFLSKISDVSLKPLKMGCAAWGLRILNSPATLAANASKDVINFVTILTH